MENSTSKIKYGGVILEHNPKAWLFLGGNSKLDNTIAVENGDWTKYLPKNEKQFNKKFDTWNCVAFSACNVIEIYFKYLLKNNKISEKNIEWLKNNGYLIDGEVNFSDRFVGVKAGTKVGTGNTGFNIANAINNNGLIPESFLPFSDDMDDNEYYTGTTKEIDKLGKEFKNRFLINFESFFVQNSREALKYSPLQVYVYAWKKDDKGVYYSPDKPQNHAVTKIRMDDKQIFDHYNPYIKTLTKNFKYYASGYKYTVAEKIKSMNIEEFLKNNDLLFVRNQKTGQFGRIMQGKLKVVNTQDRGTLMLLDDSVRRNGRGLTNDEWDKLPKENF